MSIEPPTFELKEVDPEGKVLDIYTQKIGEIFICSPPTSRNVDFIGENGKLTVRIDVDTGNVEFGEGIEVYDAAKAFWKAIEILVPRKDI